MKKRLHGNRFGLNEEVIAATESYSEVKDKSLYKHVIEKLEMIVQQMLFFPFSPGTC